MGRPSYPVQREAVVIEITFSLRPRMGGVEITKVGVRMGSGADSPLKLRKSSDRQRRLVLRSHYRDSRIPWRVADHETLAFPGASLLVGLGFVPGFEGMDSGVEFAVDSIGVDEVSFPSVRFTGHPVFRPCHESLANARSPGDDTRK